MVEFSQERDVGDRAILMSCMRGVRLLALCLLGIAGCQRSATASPTHDRSDRDVSPALDGVRAGDNRDVAGWQPDVVTRLKTAVLDGYLGLPKDADDPSF